ncbi:MAG: FAD-dependent pyridine nucleotide-disulfide oxidoreductase, partial [Clostridia bacterium]|nr:FAD-dependent pyridine nucleotide-disulfide oxidoreductase [Clostridia bacterium]
MSYVIIGNSAAAVGCVEGIRQIDKKTEIIIISKESHHTYSRPLISYLINGKTDYEKMKYRNDSFYSDMGCKTMLGRNVVGIDNENKNAVLENGEKVNYSKLLVATGSVPFIPSMEGLEKVKDKFSFMSLDDAKALEKSLSPNKKVLIIGAGLIGLKCAEGIYGKVDKITVIDLAPRILPSILDEKGSEIVKKHIEDKGLNFILSDSVASFTENSANLKSGKVLDFDILVIAVGVRPNTELLKAIGASVNRGIITDQYCKTTIPDIYSAGDCSESFDVSTDEMRVMALLPNAYMQGECAGINMAGGEKLYQK